MANINTQDSHRISKNCKRCGRKLKKPESRELGYGNICYKRMIIEQEHQRLFTLEKKREVKNENN